MELKIYRDTIHTAGVLGDILTEIPLETEILIPDYLPAVFKIVKTLIHRVVLQKQVQGGHLLLEGYFRAEVFYQGDDQSLCSVEQKIAFSKQQDIKGLEEKTVDAVDVAGELQYINCRAVSQRRLDLRGAYNLQTRILGGTDRPVIMALTEDGVQQKAVSVPAIRLTASREKQFTLEENFSFDVPAAQVLHTRMFFRVQDVHVVAGKAVVKGDVRAELLYRGENESAIRRQEVVLPYNQIAEMPHTEDDSVCKVLFEPVGCAVREGEDGKVQLVCTGILTVRAVKPVEFVAVRDCFSTICQTETVYGEFLTDTLEETLSNDVSVPIEGNLPDESLEVLQCFTEYGAPELFPEKEQTAVRGKVTAHLFCRNPLGEIDCYDKTAEYVLPKKYVAASGELSADLHALCQGIRFTQNREAVQAEIVLRVQGFLYKKQKNIVLDEVTCGQPLEKDTEVSLRVYYAAEGEEVFDIAKRYHASPAAISALAGIEGSVLHSRSQLLIPQEW